MEVVCNHCGETWDPTDILERERIPFVAGGIVLREHWDVMWGASMTSAARGDLTIHHCPSCPRVTLVVADPEETEPIEAEVEVLRPARPELPPATYRPN